MSAVRQRQFQAADVAQLLHVLLRDTAASGRRRRLADALTAPVVAELISHEWLDWEDELLVLTATGREALAMLAGEASCHRAGPSSDSQANAALAVSAARRNIEPAEIRT